MHTRIILPLFLREQVFHRNYIFNFVYWNFKFVSKGAFSYYELVAAVRNNFYLFIFIDPLITVIFKHFAIITIYLGNFINDRNPFRLFYWRQNIFIRLNKSQTLCIIGSRNMVRLCIVCGNII